MRKFRFPLVIALAMIIAPGSLLRSLSALQAQSFAFTVSVKNPASHYLNVEMFAKDMPAGIIDFRMPVWTPGYYQFLNFHENVENLTIEDEKGNVLEYANNQPNSWRIKTRAKGSYRITYDVKTVRSFVATPYVDTARAYISPPGVFLHQVGMLNKPVEVTIKPYYTWNRVATGLDSLTDKKFTYRAENFDVLYDSPILTGNLDELKPFMVNGKPHYFIGYNTGKFDGDRLMADLKKIVETSAAIIGDIPYNQYTFIPIGPGGGGIEHLNSTTFSFTGAAVDNPSSRLGILNFIAHEYFHHYNVKRIRPIELGPFDYDKGSRTKMLWVSEGLTVYYEYLVVRRAGISKDEDLLKNLRDDILAYENKPGRHFQSLAQSSYETWSDGPFGRTGDEVNKTISYYQKGPVVGWFFDFAIRNATKNTKSLDDLMRVLYNKYYKKMNRGFTEAEFRKEAETIAGTKLDELFDYIYTTKELNYTKYLGYGGLQVDTTHKKIEGGWLGLGTRVRNDSVYVTSVDYESPAYKAGIRQGSVITMFQKSAAGKGISAVLKDKQPGDEVEIVVVRNGQSATSNIKLGQKEEQGFEISKIADPSPVQQAIYRSWTGEK